MIGTAMKKLLLKMIKFPARIKRALKLIVRLDEYSEMMISRGFSKEKVKDVNTILEVYSHFLRLELPLKTLKGATGYCFVSTMSRDWSMSGCLLMDEATDLSCPAHGKTIDVDPVCRQTAEETKYKSLKALPADHAIGAEETLRLMKEMMKQ